MRRNKEAGQALAFAAVGMIVLLGFLGLAIDMGVLRYDKRLQQTAADAAALAGASNLASASGGMLAGALDAAKGDGFGDTGTYCSTGCPNSGDIGYTTVTVNNPPLSGPHMVGTTNATKYVEVIVSVVQPTFFMKALNVQKQVVAARAVATNLGGGPAAGCLYTLQPPTSSIEGVNINGNATLNAPTCGIEDNGNYNTKGNALTVKAGSFGVSGSKNVSGPGGSVTCGTPGACPTYGMPAAADPLAGIAPPSNPGPPTGCKSPCSVSTSGGTTKNPVVLNPGEYSSITIGKNSVVLLNPGIYYIDGSNGVQFNGSATVTGSGVMFYFTGSASINAVGGGNQVSNIQLSAPTSGPYAGILMYQDPNDTNVGGNPNSGPTLGGDDKSFFDGVLYFPNDQITFFGNAGSSNCVDGYSVGIVITGSFALSGHPTVCLQGQAGLPNGVSILTVPTLVE
jgi:hypothetical protein